MCWRELFGAAYGDKHPDEYPHYQQPSLPATTNTLTTSSHELKESHVAPAPAPPQAFVCQASPFKHEHVFDKGCKPAITLHQPSVHSASLVLVIRFLAVAP